MNSTNLMTLAFVAALALNILVKLWLMTRQNQHVTSHRAQVPKNFADTITLEQHQKAADYTLAKSQVSCMDLLLESVVMLGWTLLGGLEWLNQTLLNWLGTGLTQELALVFSFMLMGGLISLPLGWYQTFVIEERFGFNKTTPQLWFIDLLKGLALGAVLGLPLLSLVLWLMEMGGDVWWLWAWCALVAFQLLMMWIAPNWLMPLFNKFTPLEDSQLIERITSLMNKSGFKAKGFFVMDGSKRSAHSNAFFTGIGSSKRVVFFDTLLQQLSAEEMEAVLAHELGHFKHKHILKMMFTSFALTLLGLALLGWLMTHSWFFTGLGVTPSVLANGTAQNNALALLLFMMVVPLITFLSAPLSSARSRKQEFEADAYAAQVSSASWLKSALIKLYQDNASTLTPDPWYVKFYYSHPPAFERLERMGA
jgi:STE24 endopeptidase